MVLSLCYLEGYGVPLQATRSKTGAGRRGIVGICRRHRRARTDPMMLWIVALMAPGSFAAGGRPAAPASTTARALFCMPVSIETVRRAASSRPAVFAAK